MNAEAGVQGKGLAGVLPGKPDVAEFVVGPGQAVVGAGLLETIARVAGAIQSGVVLGYCPGGIAHGCRGFAQAIACDGFLAPVAEFPEDVQGTQVMAAGLLGSSLP